MRFVIVPSWRCFAAALALAFCGQNLLHAAENTAAAASAEAKSLNDDELRLIEKAIVQFEADEFQIRDDAQTHLIELGPKAQPRLAQRVREIEKLGAASAEVSARLHAAIHGIDVAEIEKVMQGLENAIANAPQHFVPPDARAKQALAESKMSFEWTDAPLNTVLPLIAKRAHALIAIDPYIETQGFGNCPITLKVAEMPSNQVLDAVLKLAELEAVARGSVIVATHPARAAKLSLQARTVVLPVAEGDAPWTLEETQALAELVKEWPLHRDDDTDGALFSWDAPDLSETASPGNILFHASANKLENLERFAKTFSAAPPQPAGPPAWTSNIETKLDEKVSFDAAETPLSELLTLLNEKLKITLVVEQAAAVAGADGTAITLAAKELPAREAIVKLCQMAELSVDYRNDALVLAKIGENRLKAGPCMIDARPALRAGIAQEEVRAKLDALLEEAHLPPTSHLLRGRWLVLADPWTAQRAAKLIADAAKAGKIQPAPAAPWFFATFGK